MNNAEDDDRNVEYDFFRIFQLALSALRQMVYRTHTYRSYVGLQAQVRAISISGQCMKVATKTYVLLLSMGFFPIVNYRC